MGVPKFYRWLSERYPKITQRRGVRPSRALLEEHYGGGGGAGVGAYDDVRDEPDGVVDKSSNEDGAGATAAVSDGAASASSSSTATTSPQPTTLTTAAITPPDPISECGLAPEIDRLYIDFNGVLHCCSHSNHLDEGSGPDDLDGPSALTQEEIVRNVCYYLDRIVTEVAQPHQLLYIAVDGVAPRAKLNQQRGRRYRSGKEGEIEQTVYDAYLESVRQQQQQQQQRQNGDDANGESDYYLHHSTAASSSSSGRQHHHHPEVKQVGPGRYSGKFETDDSDSKEGTSIVAMNVGAGGGAASADRYGGDDLGSAGEEFHSVAITPGTQFLVECSRQVQEFVRRKLTEAAASAGDGDDKNNLSAAWRNLEVVFSGPDVPGEGEHKIMQFIREQQQSPDYSPNLRHCIMGQDGDLILLGLVTHEPNLCLLREQVLFDKKLRQYERKVASSNDPKVPIDMYVRNPNFEFLHMNVLRDYLALEFETSNVLPKHSKFDLERTIDDLVFLSFFVGNDFLPHMPALDIADMALDFLMYAYRDQRHRWLKHGTKEEKKNPYLTYAGEIVSGKRLESFLQVIGSHETRYYDYKKSTEDMDAIRRYEAKYGRSTTPSDDVMKSKEAMDRLKYREMLLRIESSSSSSATETDSSGTYTKDGQASSSGDDFEPVMTTKLSDTGSSNDNDGDISRDAVSDEDRDGLVARMASLLQYSLSGRSTSNASASKVDRNDSNSVPIDIDDQDLKGRYYYDKFGFTPFDADKHTALRKSYIEGLVWNLQYYYHGCVSWEWYYPYHYGPMISDLVGVEDLLEEISFEEGEPLRPFEQLLACLPPSRASLLPKPYQSLMTSIDSPIADFYPRSFTIDMNGKRLPWEAVILLPFIDTKRLLEASKAIEQDISLTEEEQQRNQFGETVILSSNNASKDDGLVTAIPFDSSSWSLKKPKRTPLFRPEIAEDALVPLPGYPTLRDGSIASMWRKRLRVNIHGLKSRYITACLEMKNDLPEMIPIELLASQLIGTVVYIDYPHLKQALVTAISDSKAVVRGQNSRPRPWTAQEASDRKARVTQVISRYVFGEKLVGTGGLALASGGTAMEDLEVLLYVRPFRGLKTLEDGTVGRRFAKFEVEVPLFVTSWAPTREDERLAGIPALLEKDPYSACKMVITDPTTSDPMRLQEQANRRNNRPKRRNFLPASAQLRRPRGIVNATADFPRSEATARVFSSSAIVDQHLQPLLSLHFVTGHPSFMPLGRSWTSLNAVDVLYTRDNIERNNVMRMAPSHLTRKNALRAMTRNTGRGSPSGRIIAFGVVLASFFASITTGVEASSFGLSGLPDAPPSVRVAEGARPRYGLESSNAKPLKFLHGTTTLSFTFRGGVIVAVDSRASLGNFVGSKTTQKVLPISSHILGTMAGGAADCSFWIRKLRAEASFHELTEEGNRRMSVARASRLLSNALYENRALGLSVGTMIAGYDDEDGAPPRIFYVDNSGMRIESDMFAVGSGSSFALGILDVERRFDMTDDEAVALAIKAIRYATFRDAGSGGFINVYLITQKDGWRRVYSEDLARLTNVQQQQQLLQQQP